MTRLFSLLISKIYSRFTSSQIAFKMISSLSERQRLSKKQKKERNQCRCKKQVFEFFQANSFLQMDRR
ncbi:MAG: hypothetical protein DRJ06_01095 [Candidatus Aminicenantes bacterium]|nr:MAG: hypothetical protein DRJ06_01095 [Candidatus Aminicenantes bacterium]